MIARPRSLHLAAVAALSVVVLALAPIALAGKGGGGGKKPGGTTGGSGSLGLVVVSSPYNDNLPHWSGQITWNVSTTASSEPNVSVKCSQNGTVVYSATTGYYAGYPWPWTQTMTLSSQSWTAGDASCVGKLFYFSGSSQVTLASVSFTAYS